MCWFIFIFYLSHTGKSVYRYVCVRKGIVLKYGKIIVKIIRKIAEFYVGGVKKMETRIFAKHKDIKEKKYYLVQNDRLPCYLFRRSPAEM